MQLVGMKVAENMVLGQRRLAELAIGRIAGRSEWKDMWKGIR